MIGIGGLGVFLLLIYHITNNIFLYDAIPIKEILHATIYYVQMKGGWEKIEWRKIGLSAGKMSRFEVIAQNQLLQAHKLMSDDKITETGSDLQAEGKKQRE